MTTLATKRAGTGPPLVLIHGGLAHGDLTWGDQAPLAERWTLVVPDRVGYGASAALSDGEDFDRDAELLAPALDPGSHLVGYSSGAMAALLTAARRPEAIASLTLIEPPAFHLLPDNPRARRLVQENDRLWDAPCDDPIRFLEEFFKVQEMEPLPRAALEQLQGPAVVWHGFKRRPWAVDLPLDELAQQPFPKLVLSGGHHDVFEELCDLLADRLGAERDVIPGAGHRVQRTGDPFNERLERFLATAREPRPGPPSARMS